MQIIKVGFDFLMLKPFRGIFFLNFEMSYYTSYQLSRYLIDITQNTLIQF